jgi:isopentenyldiphosphate isomerase
MELVDIYNQRHEKLNYTKDRKELIKGEYRLSCFVWIINDKNEILIQQRVATAKKYPNMWETVSGGALADEASLSGSLRELEEEIGLFAAKEDMIFIGSYTRFNDFVEVWLLKSNIDIKALKFEENEVQNAKWVSINEFEEMIDNKTAVGSGFTIFKMYYNEIYNKHIEYIDGNLIIKNNK